MTKRAVVNFARGGWYAQGRDRLWASLDAVNFDGQLRFYCWEDALGCRPHSEQPYAFKPHALLAAHAAGDDVVLWCDASVWAIRDLGPVFAHIEEHGHLLFYNCSTGPWASDASLKYFGMDREQAFATPMLMGLCMGLDLRQERPRKFMRQWLDAVPTFGGSWTNAHGEVSDDLRVNGHRHDQTASSIIAHRLGMNLTIAHQTFLHVPDWKVEETTRDPRIAGSVALLAQGM